MADDFKVGDVVVCVLAGPTIQEGSVHRVVGLRVGPAMSLLGISSLGLFLKGKTSVGGKGSYNANRFRKLPPASDEFTQRIRACRPVRERQPA